MDATILFITFAKATGNVVTVIPIQLHVIASTIIPVLQAMETSLGMMVKF
jgi:hypothetical protein